MYRLYCATDSTASVITGIARCWARSTQNVRVLSTELRPEV